MTSDCETTKKMITLMGSDNVEVVLEEAAAMKSEMLRFLIEDNCANDVIHIPDITAAILSKVFHYCQRYIGVVEPQDEFIPKIQNLKDFDDDFVDVDVNTLYDLLLAANYLEVKSLLKLLCKKTADLIRGKSPEEIRQTFNIENDLTPEEEEEIRSKNPWAFNDI